MNHTVSVHMAYLFNFDVLSLSYFKIFFIVINRVLLNHGFCILCVLKFIFYALLPKKTIGSPFFFKGVYNNVSSVQTFAIVIGFNLKATGGVTVRKGL